MYIGSASDTVTVFEHAAKHFGRADREFAFGDLERAELRRELAQISDWLGRPCIEYYCNLHPDMHPQDVRGLQSVRHLLSLRVFLIAERIQLSGIEDDLIARFHCRNWGRWSNWSSECHPGDMAKRFLPMVRKEPLLVTRLNQQCRWTIFAIQCWDLEARQAIIRAYPFRDSAGQEIVPQRTHLRLIAS